MSDATDNLILEHLRTLRNDIATFRTDAMDRFDTLTARVASLEDQMVVMRSDMNGMHADIARLDHRLRSICTSCSELQ